MLPRRPWVRSKQEGRFCKDGAAAKGRKTASRSLTSLPGCSVSSPNSMCPHNCRSSIELPVRVSQ